MFSFFIISVLNFYNNNKYYKFLLFAFLSCIIMLFIKHFLFNVSVWLFIGTVCIWHNKETKQNIVNEMKQKFAILEQDLNNLSNITDYEIQNTFQGWINKLLINIFLNHAKNNGIFITITLTHNQKQYSINYLTSTDISNVKFVKNSSNSTKITMKICDGSSGSCVPYTVHIF